MNVQIREISISKRDKVTKYAEVGLEASDIIVPAYFELDAHSFASRDLLWSEFNAVLIDLGFARGSGTIFVLSWTRR